MDGHDCPICCEKFTKSVRKPVECRYCNFVACMVCCKRDALEVENPRCMNCNKIWYGDDIKFPKAFIDTELRAHITEFIFEYEKSQLANTLEYFKIKNALSIYKYPANRENIINRHYADILERVNETGNLNLLNIKFDQVALVRHLKSYYDVITRRGDTSDIVPFELCGDGKNSELDAASILHIACGSSTCLGFLDARYKCNLCGVKYCNKCRNPLDKDHECNPDDIASLKLIMMSTKKCPKCSTAIHKIEGCNQMFCVRCNTAFSYKSGKIITGNIHNPHYFDWMNRRRAQGENGEMRGCDNIGTILSDSYNKLANLFQYNCQRLAEVFYRLCYPIIELRFGFDNLTSTVVKTKTMLNLTVRQRYLLGEIDAAEFKRLCYLNVRQNARNEETAKFVDVIRLIHEDLLITLVKIIDGFISEASEQAAAIKLVEMSKIREERTARAAEAEAEDVQPVLRVREKLPHAHVIHKRTKKVNESEINLTNDELCQIVSKLVKVIHSAFTQLNLAIDNFNTGKLITNQIHLPAWKFRGDLVRYVACFDDSAYKIMNENYNANYVRI